MPTYEQDGYIWADAPLEDLGKKEIDKNHMLFLPIPDSDAVQCKDIPDLLVWFILTHPRYKKLPVGVGQALAKIYPPMVVYRKLERWADKGWLEYGTSLMTPWLTKEGEKKAEAFFSEVWEAFLGRNPLTALYEHMKYITTKKGDE